MAVPMAAVAMRRGVRHALAPSGRGVGRHRQHHADEQQRPATRVQVEDQLQGVADGDQLDEGPHGGDGQVTPKPSTLPKLNAPARATRARLPASRTRSRSCRTSQSWSVFPPVHRRRNAAVRWAWPSPSSSTPAGLPSADAALDQQVEAVGHASGLLHGVGHPEHGDAPFGGDAPTISSHVLARGGIQGAGGLVEQQHGGVVGQARARATRWAWPPDSSLGGLGGQVRFQAEPARAARPPGARPGYGPPAPVRSARCRPRCRERRPAAGRPCPPGGAGPARSRGHVSAVHVRRCPAAAPAGG